MVCLNVRFGHASKQPLPLVSVPGACRTQELTCSSGGADDHRYIPSKDRFRVASGKAGFINPPSRIVSFDIIVRRIEVD
jgi:hypothetical protein